MQVYHDARAALRSALQERIALANHLHLASLGKTISDTLVEDIFAKHPDLGMAVHQLASGLSELMLADDHFATMDGKLIQRGAGRNGIHPHFTAEALLKCAISSGADEALAWLDSVIETSEARGYFILSIWGIRVENPIQLSPELTLMPAEQLPESHGKAILRATGGNRNLMTAFDFEMPSTALVHSCIINPVFSHQDSDVPDTQAFSKAQETLDTVAGLLGLIGPQLSLPSASWFMYEDLAIERLCTGASRYHRSIEVIPVHIPQAPYLIADEAISLVNAHQKLPERVAERVNVAIERLSLALRRHDSADRAVELSIALESLLTDQQPNEVTHKVKVRATRLLGGSDDVRAFNFAIVGRTYEIRSTLVHTGKRDRRSKMICGVALSPEAVAEQCGVLCTQIIKKIIFDQQFPDWAAFDIA